MSTDDFLRTTSNTWSWKFLLVTHKRQAVLTIDQEKIPRVSAKPHHSMDEIYQKDLKATYKINHSGFIRISRG